MDGASPSRPISKLGRWLEIHDSKGNVFFAVLAVFLVWDLRLAAAVEGWRRRHGQGIVVWLHALGEIEALVSLGGYAFENPADPFPTFEESGPCFHGEGIAHPLLPSDRAIRNDVFLDGQRHMLVIPAPTCGARARSCARSGSIPFAPSPARRCAPWRCAFRPSRWAPPSGFRIRFRTESRFYAEIKRVRQVLDIARGTLPLLFLLDEIFDSTNSAERRVGAEAVVRSLVDRRAIGLVTSHDLALAEIAVSLDPRAQNVHFEDHLEGDRMAFDYKIKPGPVERGNALGLMRAVGLEV